MRHCERCQRQELSGRTPSVVISGSAIRAKNMKFRGQAVPPGGTDLQIEGAELATTVGRIDGAPYFAINPTPVEIPT
jgi:hypothetical protein